MDIRPKLDAAINNNFDLDIIYYGGSKPGYKRKVKPISIDGNHLNAFCYISNYVKTFVIEKILLLDGTEKEQFEQNEKLKTYKEKLSYNDFNSLNDFIKIYQSKLEGMGWCVNHCDNFISLHSYYKNGNPKKGISAAIQFSEFTEKRYLEIDDNDELYEKIENKASQRPWRVTPLHGNSKTFTTLPNALECFLESLSNSK